MHADAYTHFLMDRGKSQVAPNSRVPDLTDEEALRRLRTDLGNAYRTARDPDTKVAMDYTRTVFSDSWHRLPALMKTLDDLQQSGRTLTNESAWFGFQGIVGDEVKARRLAAEVETKFSHFFELLWVYHQLGDEDKVTRLTHAIDAEPLGPQLLLLSLMLHGNRMVFDLDDAPNFRTRLAEMGLDASRFQPMPRFAATDE